MKIAVYITLKFKYIFWQGILYMQYWDIKYLFWQSMFTMHTQCSSQAHYMSLTGQYVCWA
jgi:hypothetical protein